MLVGAVERELGEGPRRTVDESVEDELPVLLHQVVDVAEDSTAETNVSTGPAIGVCCLRYEVLSGERGFSAGQQC